MPDGCEECKVSCETESGLHCLLVDDGDKWGWKKLVPAFSHEGMLWRNDPRYVL